jgi:hypothetical protein
MAGMPRTTGTEDALAVVESPFGFFSYSHEDWDAAVRLVEELKLRGFVVFRDIERMREGRPLEHEMGEGVDNADLLMCLLTENSLSSKPVVEKELKPALRKATREGRPVVMPVVCGLGSSHEKVTERTWGVLQHDFTGAWSGGILAAPADALTPDDAAAMARKAVNAVFPRDRGPAEGTWRLQVATHGSPVAADGLSVDATSFLGGDRRQVGHPAAWERVRQAVVDLERALRAHGLRRDIEVTGGAHLTAAFLTGFAFRRTAGWRLTVRANDDVCYPQANVTAHDALRFVPEPGSLDSTFITAEVNLLGSSMDSLVDDILSSLGRPALRLRVEHANGSEYIPCEDLAAMASATARAIRDAVSDRRADRVHLFLSAPFSFAAFLGAELNAVGAFVQLYERADHRYHASLELEGR